MGWFDDETGIEPLGDGRFATRLTSAWNIGESANGGYALSPVLRSLRDVGGHRDPISVTTHFLRPVQIAGDASPAEVRSDAIRRGRTTSVARGTLVHDARERLTVVAAFGDLGDVSGESDITRPAPCIPEPDHCLDRSGLEQGVGLPILGRLDVRIHPDRAVAGGLGGFFDPVDHHLDLGGLTVGAGHHPQPGHLHAVRGMGQGVIDQGDDVVRRRLGYRRRSAGEWKHCDAEGGRDNDQGSTHVTQL